MRANWLHGLQITLILTGGLLVTPSQPARASIDPVELSEKVASPVAVEAQQVSLIMTRFMLGGNTMEVLSTPWSDLAFLPSVRPALEELDVSTLPFSRASYRPFLPLLHNVPQVVERPRPRSDGLPRRVFGSVAISIAGSVHAAQWSRVLAEKADRLLTGICESSSRACSNPLLLRARQVVHDARPLEREAKARLINRFVNETVRYTTDIETYGEADYWATLTETFARGRGDCEDIAIVKMWMLKAAGVDMADLHLVLGRQLRLQADHAILVMRSDNAENFYLDNLNNVIEAPQKVVAFQPLVSYGVHGSWIHGYQSAASEKSTRTN